VATTEPGDHPWRPVPPGSTPLRELAHAIAAALTLPGNVTEREELEYLRASRDHARIVLFAMRRIITEHELHDNDLMAIVATIRDHTSKLAAGDTAPADPFRAFVKAIITALSVAPDPPTSEVAYLQSARQRARRVLLACRHAIEAPRIEDPHLDTATRLLITPGDDGQAPAPATEHETTP
jgi:hypothetical protein